MSGFALRRTVAVVFVLAGVPQVVSLARGASPDGELLYRTYCTACHGLAGDGKGINVPDMAVQPRDHTDSREMSTRSDDDLARAIVGGGPAVGKSVLMPAWGGILDEEEVSALVRHLRMLSGGASGETGAPAGGAAALVDVPAGGQGHDHDHAAMAMPAAMLGPERAEAPPPPEELRRRYPDSRLHEFELRAEERELQVAPGFRSKVWGFNGQVPGPLLHIREGDEVKVEFVNLSSMEHTIHWHGMHQIGSWRSDGVPNVTQQAVPPGGSYLYHFIATRPGTLWYHCHVNVPEHVGLRGMWGPLIVEPREPTELEKEVTRDAILMFSGWNSKVADRFGVGGHPGEVLDYYSINGKSFPLTQPLRVREGDVVRLRLFGAGTDVAFHLHGHDMLVTHKDGLPLEAPFEADVLYVEEGARYDVIFRANNPGLWIDHDHIEHHVSNAGSAPGGAVMIVEYEGVEKPPWYVWRNKKFDPNFYYGESLAEGYGLFEHDGFQGDDLGATDGRP